MREILFRGKTDTGKWVEGYYGQFHNRPILDRENSHQIFEPKEDAYLYKSAIGGLWHIVIPKTVGQYTGITDKNGKKIFEGDIVNIEYNTIVKNAVIEYRGASFYGSTFADLWELDNFYEIEVVGNIHDNPELWEGGDAE